MDFGPLSLLPRRLVRASAPSPSSLLAGMANRQTAILMQPSPNKATRTFKNYDSITQAMHGICALYERKLKDLYSTVQHLGYDISDLYNYRWPSRP